MLRVFTTQTTLRENTQPYRFWGLKIFTPLTLRFQDFQRMPLKNNVTNLYYVPTLWLQDANMKIAPVN
jgi:hypothetical protein